MRKKHVVGFVGITAYVIFQSAAAWSAGTVGLPSAAGGSAATGGMGTTTGDPTVSGPQVSSLPPMFDASVAQSMGSQMLNCFNVGAALNGIMSAVNKPSTLGANTGDQINNAISGLGANLGGNSFVPGGGCGPDTVDTSTFSCPLNAKPDAIDKLVKARQARLDQALGAIQCEKNKFEAVQTQLSCLQNQAQTLQAQIGTLQKSYQDNIQRMQSDVALIDSVTQDRTTQLQDVTNRLGGSSGSPGLMKMLDLVQGAVQNAMPGDILTIKNQFQAIDNGTKAMAETIQSRMMQSTTTCFNTNSAGGFRCSPNGPPVSIRDYILCRYQQNQQLGNGGVIETNQIVGNQAAAGAQSLDALLSQIMGASAKVQAPSQDPQAGFNAAMNSTTTINTPDDIEAQYGAQLAAYNGKGLDIHGFVMAQLRSCYTTAQQVINREKNMASSPIGAQQAALDAQTRANQSQVNTFFDKYGQMYTQAMASLTGQHLPINTSACVGANPTVQQGCLDDMKRNMAALLNGTSPNSTMNIQIRGTNPQNAIPVTCQGLQGCVTALQSTSDNLNREVTRLGQFKKDYVLKANQNVQNFTKQMAQMLSPTNAMIQQKLSQMNQVLAGMGVSPLNVKPVQGEDPQPDSNGLPGVPKNVLGLVGSQMNPQLLDMQGDSFGQGMQNIADARNKLGDKEGTINQAKTDLIAQAQDCTNNYGSTMQNRLQAAVTRYQDCFQTMDFVQQVCGSNSGLKDTLPGLVESVNNILAGGTGGMPGSDGNDAGAATLNGFDCSVVFDSSAGSGYKVWQGLSASCQNAIKQDSSGSGADFDARCKGPNDANYSAAKDWFSSSFPSGKSAKQCTAPSTVANMLAKDAAPFLQSDSGDGSSAGAR